MESNGIHRKTFYDFLLKIRTLLLTQLGSFYQVRKDPRVDSAFGGGRYFSYHVVCAGNEPSKREPYETRRQTLNKLGWLLPQ